MRAVFEQLELESVDGGCVLLLPVSLCDASRVSLNQIPCRRSESRHRYSEIARCAVDGGGVFKDLKGACGGGRAGAGLVAKLTRQTIPSLF